MLRFSNSSITFGPHPFVLTETRQGIMLSCLTGKTETLISARGILLAPVMTGYLGNCPYSALPFLRDDKLCVVLFDGATPKVIDTIYTLKGEMLVSAYADEENLYLVADRKVILVSFKDEGITYRTPYENCKLVAQSLQFGKRTAMLLTENDDVYFPTENLFYSNMKALSKTIFFAPVTAFKFYRILRSKITGIKFLYLNEDGHVYRLVNIKTDAEKFYNFDDYIAWQDGANCVFLNKDSQKCFSIPALLPGHSNNLQPIVYKNKPAVCEISHATNYEMLVKVHDGKNIIFEKKLSLFLDSPAKDKFRKDYFNAPYDTTDVAVFFFENTLILKVANSFVYLIKNGREEKVIGELDILSIQNKYVIFNSRKNELIVPDFYHTARCI